MNVRLKIIGGGMKRLSKWWLLLLGSLILVVFPLGILYLSAVDNTEKLVHALLFQPKGNLDEKTFLATMIARFPKGTKVSELTSFVNSIVRWMCPVLFVLLLKLDSM